jgi:hypothetical protein
VRRHVHVQPGDVQPDAGVGRHAAEVGAEVFDSVVGDREEEDVAYDSEDVGADDVLGSSVGFNHLLEGSGNIPPQTWSTDPPKTQRQ